MKTDVSKFNPYSARSGEMFGAMRRFFLGRKFPDLYTRIISNLGILSFIYNFGWSVMIFMILDFGTGLPRYKQWNMYFENFGNLYGVVDIHLMFNVYLFAVMGLSVFMMAGIMMAWRGKKAGYMMVVIAQVLLVAVPFLVLGVSYFAHEVYWYEWGSALLIMLIFLVGYFLRRKEIISG